MADSNITKQALAAALKELMEQVPFDKVQVQHICERCGMNRKSFYYHFKDKYDLLNWIFDTEILSFFYEYTKLENFESRVDLIQKVCDYFYDNRNFYRKALQIEGQNSFSEHFKDCVAPLFRFRLEQLIGEDADEFAVNFFVDACICALERWLLDENCISSEQFVAKLMNLLQSSSEAIHREIHQPS